MKKYILLLLVLVATATLPVTGQEPLPPLPGNVRSELTTALKGVNVSDPAAVKAVVLQYIGKFPTLAPQVVSTTVEIVGNALSNNPSLATEVIVAFVDAACDARPKLAPQIVFDAVRMMPSNIRLAVLPSLVNAVIEGLDRRNKARILNAAYLGAGYDRPLIALLDEIALREDIRIVDRATGKNPKNPIRVVDGYEEDPNYLRYFVDDQYVNWWDTWGEQGFINAGLVPFGGSGGGGSPNPPDSNPPDNNPPQPPSDNPPAS